MAYPFPAIDTGRNTERLSAFLSEYIESKPVDQYFEDYPTLSYFYKQKRTIDGGAQLSFQIGKGESPNSAWARDYDLIGSAGTNNTTTVVYDFANIFDAYVISWAEMREISGSDHKIFDRVSTGRDVVQNTTNQKLNEAFYAAAIAADKITPLPTAILATGACGSLSQGTEAVWASQISNHGAAYTADGYGTILGMFQKLREVKSKATAMLTSFALERAIEKEMNVDVRYSDSPDTLKRGASKLMIKNTPIIADADATADTIYFVNSDTARLYVDTEGDMQWDEMMDMPYQKAYMSKFCFRGQFVITDRRGQGKITNITG